MDKRDYTKNTTNLDCNLYPYSKSITVESGKSYVIYPVTVDGGYIENLKRELYIPDSLSDNNISQFKYTVNDNLLKLLYEF
ncbi:hypothetical protein [Lachnospira sp.]|jgi:hypothetical protein|uniref:hypothetical protein n=1 Tax=Lachnospira sp. TaxID=2049031 RepID=UPI00257DBB67|nr:hypothetical protein [Lachnospira sp.]